MTKKLSLLAIAVAAMAYVPMAAWGCSGSSAQLNDGTKVAQGYGAPTAQPMQDQNGSQSMDQNGAGSSDSNSSNDKQ